MGSLFLFPSDHVHSLLNKQLFIGKANSTFLVLLTRVHGFTNQWKLTTVQIINSSKALLGPLLQHWGTEQARDSLACFLSKVEQACSLYRVRVQVGSEIRPEGWFRWFYPPFRWWCVQGAYAIVPCLCSRHTIFAPGFPKVAVGCFGFCNFWVQSLPQLCVHSYF